MSNYAKSLKTCDELVRLLKKAGIATLDLTEQHPEHVKEIELLLDQVDNALEGVYQITRTLIEDSVH